MARLTMTARAASSGVEFRKLLVVGLVLIFPFGTKESRADSTVSKRERHEKIRATLLKDLSNYETTDSLAYARWPQFQIPRDSLATTSTLDLVDDFATSPIRGTMFQLSVANLELRAHQLARYSASFQEYLQRKDRVGVLLDYYAALQPTNEEYSHVLTGRTTSSVFCFTVLELAIGYVPVLKDASDAELRRTIRTVLAKREELERHEVETGESVSTDICPAVRAVGRALFYLSDPDFLKSGITVQDLNGCMTHGQEGLNRVIEMGRSAISE